MAKRDNRGKFIIFVKSKKCDNCSQSYQPYKKYSRFCTRDCFNYYRQKHKKVKPKIIYNKKPYTITKRGYVTIELDGKIYYQHRMIMEKYIGRKLKTEEHIHHINGIKSDNNIENLEILTISEHTRLHSTKPLRLCSLCELKHYAKGFCRNHYRKQRRLE